MKALVKSRRERGLWLEDVPEPEYGINDVLIRVRCTGICGTDVHIYKWDEWAQKTIPVPMVIGHEFVGEIVEVGSNVNDFHPGEIVSGEGHVVCGRCRNCLAGRRHLCAYTSGVGVNRPGAFAEYIVLPMTNIWRHDPNVEPGSRRDLRSLRQRRAHGALLSGAGRGRADHRRRADRHHGMPVVRHAGARHVVITDLNPYRLELARKMGVTLAVNTAETPLREVQKQLGMPEGFDVGWRCPATPRPSAT